MSNHKLSEIRKLLVNPNAKSGEKNVPIFEVAVKKQNLDLVKKFLDHPKFDIKKSGSNSFESLFWSCSNKINRDNVIEITKLLINAGASMEEKAICCLCIDFAPPECLKLILKAGVDYKSANDAILNYTPIEFANFWGKDEAYKILVEHDPDLEKHF